VAKFAYDPEGRRVEKVAGGVTTSYVYDDADILRESRGGVTQKYVSGGIDELFSTEDGTSTSYVHQDAMGSVVATTNAGGSVLSAPDYDAWGVLRAGGSEPGHTFTGREWDPQTGMYYYRARYYDPAVGRFITEDPMRFRAGVNFFAYVSNNPTNRIDPLGLKDETSSART
jgi:RHS repeat-associated protein